jgi:intracellular septation protein A
MRQRGKASQAILQCMALWTYRLPFQFEGQAYRVDFAAGFTRLDSRLLGGERLLAEDHSEAPDFDGLRNHHLQARLPDGRRIEVEAGYFNWWSVGIAVRVDGRLVHESHPGRRLQAPGAALRSVGATQRPEAATLARQRAEARAQWQRNRPSLFTDIALGVLFYVVAQWTDSLTTAALVGAGAGLLAAVAQRLTKIDLLGGFALFGIFMLLLSAAFSLAFDSDWAVQMKSTVLGGLVAVVTLADAGLNGGRYFGTRTARYLPSPIHFRRFTTGLGLVGLAMAGMNYAVAALLSRDTWLLYTTFGDFVLSIGLFLSVMNHARLREGERQHGDIG